MENADSCWHHFYIHTNGNRSLIIPQFQKNLINFQGKSAPFFAHLSNIFPKFHNIQLSEFTLRLFGENPRGYLKRREELNQQLSALLQSQSETSLIIMEEEKKEIPKEAIRNILQNFSKVLSSNIDRTIRKRLLHLLISEITIDKNRNIDSIKLKLSDELIRFLQNNGGTPPDGAPSVFMFRELGIKTMDLELVLS